MPSSQYYHISKIMDIVMALKPDSILDVGAGFGKYGVLCREYLELWDGRQKYSDFRKRIDCIEIFNEYITSIHKLVYDNIYVDDAVSVLGRLDARYDLVLMIDVLEHFDKETGKNLLRDALEKCGGILVSTPKKVSAQGNVFGNQFETHRSQWSKNDLSKFGQIFFVNDPVSYICYLSKKQNASRIQYHLKVSPSVKARVAGELLKASARLPGLHRMLVHVGNYWLNGQETKKRADLGIGRTYNPYTYWRKRGQFYQSSFQYDERYRIQEKFLLAALENESFATVLEIGCGFGRITRLVLQNHPEISLYTAIDLSPDQIENAKKYVGQQDGVNFVVSDFQSFESEIKHYDLVLASEVLLHVKPDEIESVIGKILSLTGKYFVHVDWCEEDKPAKYTAEAYCFMHDYEKIYDRMGLHYTKKRIVEQKSAFRRLDVRQGLFVVELPSDSYRTRIENAPAR
jgi:2-polyprenyl-3-methyl-5-hydroxy-6-metoxy-1,4-benzoquinol methylase